MESSPKPTTAVNGLRTGLTSQVLEDIPYEIAVGKVKETKEYQTLKGVCENPYLTGDYFKWIVDFIEKRAGKFWKYLLVREAGKKDKDKVRAASILEYARLLSKLVEDYPELKGRILDEVMKQFPEDFREKKPFGPAELAARLERFNQRDYLKIEPEIETAVGAERQREVSK